MTKQPSAGGEVDAYCTKCKMDLNHRIVAMEGVTIRRVECLTCRGQHNYRRPKSAEPASRLTTTQKRPTKAAAARATKDKVATEGSLFAQWAKATQDRAPEELTAYKISVQLNPGQLLSHKKFGPGVVSEVVDEGKARVLFESGVKLLVFGR